MEVSVLSELASYLCIAKINARSVSTDVLREKRDLLGREDIVKKPVLFAKHDSRLCATYSRKSPKSLQTLQSAKLTEL